MFKAWRHWLLAVVRYLSAGALGVLAGYLTLYVLTDIAGLWYMASAVAAFILNYGINFVLHKFWTFRNTRTDQAPKQLASYFAMAVGIFFANLGLLYVQVEYLHIWYILAQLVSTAILTVIGFFVSRRIFAH
jgi:dolichol-phosphate mannosyltransferase